MLRGRSGRLPRQFLLVAPVLLARGYMKGDTNYSYFFKAPVPAQGFYAAYLDVD